MVSELFVNKNFGFTSVSFSSSNSLTYDHITTSPPGFSDLPPALFSMTQIASFLFIDGGQKQT